MATLVIFAACFGQDYQLICHKMHLLAVEVIGYDQCDHDVINVGTMVAVLTDKQFLASTYEILGKNPTERFLNRDM